MKKYESIDGLKQDFVVGEFQLDDSVDVAGTIYRNKLAETFDILSMLHENEKGMVVYVDEEDKDCLMFLWGAQGNNVVPYDVRPISKSLTERDESDRVIPDKVEVHFLNLPVSGSLVAKVDTGAEMCSLHAEQITVNRQQGTVSFVAPQLSKSKLTIPLADQQAVKTSGGDTTYRPVIKVTVKIKGQVLKDIMTNLNDRGEMKDPMLIGQNALHAGKFLVDPNIMKETPQTLRDTLKHEKVLLNNTVSNASAQKLYEALEEVGDIPISSLVKILRAQVLKNIENITY